VEGESDYYPFGAERVISNTVTDNFRFAGMEWDTEDGLNHTLYRQYTPAQSRWETPDPVRGCVNFPQGQNLYPYVRDNPTNFTDPKGSTLFDPTCAQYDPSCDTGCNPATDPGCTSAWGGSGGGGAGGAGPKSCDKTCEAGCQIGADVCILGCSLLAPTVVGYFACVAGCVLAETLCEQACGCL
jgi:RHS repeat-associated protein